MRKTLAHARTFTLKDARKGYRDIFKLEIKLLNNYE